MAFEVWVSGPLIEILLNGADAAVPGRTLQGIVDTGASVICLDKRVARQLGLTAINIKPMEVADGSMVEATVYMAEMTIHALGFKDWVEIYGLPMERPSSRVLLGRSFLKNYHVTYNGPDDTFHYTRAAGRRLDDDWDG